MSPDLSRALCRSYPTLFRDLPPFTKGETCQSSPGDGWYALIDTLSKVVLEHAECMGLAPWVSDVKEKFGRLIVSVGAGDDYIEGAVETVGELSTFVCEDCGGPGTLSRRGWWRTRCARHEDGSRADRSTPLGLQNPTSSGTAISIDELVWIVSGLIMDHDSQSGHRPRKLNVETGPRGSIRLRAGESGGYIAGVLAMAEAWSRYQVRGGDG